MAGTQSNPIIDTVLDDDAPIIEPSQDRFRFDHFAKDLAEKVVYRSGKAEACFTFGLWGAWGSGKTSLIKLTQLHIKQTASNHKSEIKIVEYNPWWFSTEDQMLRELFVQLSNEPVSLWSWVKSQASWRWLVWVLGIILISWSWVMLQFHNFTTHPIVYVRVILGGILVAISVLAGARIKVEIGLAEYIDAVSDISESVFAPASKVIRGLSKFARAGSQDVKMLREKLDATFKRRDFHTVVIIDDLDRLAPADVSLLLKVIKGVTCLPNVTYLLLADRAHIVEALSSVGIPDGSGYLEKIVQYSAYLPAPAPDDLTVFFHDQLVTLVGSEVLPGKPSPLHLDPLGNLCYLYIKTPRDVKRVMNVLRVTYPLCKKSADEAGVNIEPTEFITLQILHLFDVSLYLDLFRATRARQIADLKKKYDDDRHQYILKYFNLLKNAREHEGQDVAFWKNTKEFDLYFRYISQEGGSSVSTDVPVGENSPQIVQ